MILLTAAFLLAITACTPESCLEDTLVFVKAPLYTSSDEKNIAPTNFTMYGVDIDSVIYNSSKNIAKAEIPLNPSAGSCTFIIGINTGIDTLTFIYSTFSHLISKECGYVFYHEIDTIINTMHSIDTITVKNRFVTTTDAENIRIYY